MLTRVHGTDTVAAGAAATTNHASSEPSRSVARTMGDRWVLSTVPRSCLKRAKLMTANTWLLRLLLLLEPWSALGIPGPRAAVPLSSFAQQLCDTVLSSACANRIAVLVLCASGRPAAQWSLRLFPMDPRPDGGGRCCASGGRESRWRWQGPAGGQGDRRWGQHAQETAEVTAEVTADVPTFAPALGVWGVGRGVGASGCGAYACARFAGCVSGAHGRSLRSELGCGR